MKLRPIVFSGAMVHGRIRRRTAMKLKLAENFSLPADVVTQKIAAVGRSGSGKSYAASKLVELLLEAGLQVVVVDPVGIHWGLRLSANGKDRGLDIPVLGGEHGEIALEPTAGKIVADLVAEKRASLVLDVSMMSGGEQRRFVADFAKELLHAKKKNRSPVMLVWEESQEFVPQRVGPKEAEMVGAMEKLIKIGRNFGIGTFLITQRPQATNKDVLNQTEVLLVFQMTGAHERKAILEWVVDKGLDKSLVDSLVALKEGDGYLWSPAWLQRFEKFRALPKKTLDVSATPKVGGVDASHAELPEIDLEAVKKAMAATIERQKQEDPRELRKEIARLNSELRNAKSERAVPERVEVPVLNHDVANLVKGYVEQLQEVLADGRKVVETVGNSVAPLSGCLEVVRESLSRLNGRKHGDKEKPILELNRPVPELRRAAQGRRALDGTRDLDVVGREGREGLTGPERRILDAIAWFEAIGIQEPSQVGVAFLAGYTVGGGGFNNPKGSLHTKGLVDYRMGARLSLTEAGRDLARKPDAPLTAEELHRRVMERIDGPMQRILEPLLKTYPDPMANDDLASAAGYEPGGGGYNNPRGRLKTCGLIEYPAPGMVRAAPVLFLEE